MYSPQRLVRQFLSDMDAGRLVAIERDYCRLLRRAVTLGWARAKIEYLPRERARGRPVAEIMTDLALFEDLNRMAHGRGFDPIEMQRREDLYRTALRPVTFLAAAILVAAMAASNIAVVPALLVGTGACGLSLRITKAILSLH